VGGESRRLPIGPSSAKAYFRQNRYLKADAARNQRVAPATLGRWMRSEVVLRGPLPASRSVDHVSADGIAGPSCFLSDVASNSLDWKCVRKFGSPSSAARRSARCHFKIRAE
jgi:hypothetical protein